VFEGLCLRGMVGEDVEQSYHQRALLSFDKQRKHKAWNSLLVVPKGALFQKKVAVKEYGE
jgi:hypothetical protein